MSPKLDEQQQRLAAALRQNLRRRKEQVREIKTCNKAEDGKG